MHRTGKITCNEILLNGPNGLRCYQGVDRQRRPMMSVSTPLSGDMACTSLSINDRSTSSYPNASSQDGDVTSRHIYCTSNTINQLLWKLPIERVVLNCVSPTPNPPGSTVPGRSYTRAGNGRHFKVSVRNTRYSCLESKETYW